MNWWAHLIDGPLLKDGSWSMQTHFQATEHGRRAGERGVIVPVEIKELFVPIYIGKWYTRIAFMLGHIFLHLFTHHMYKHGMKMICKWYHFHGKIYTYEKV